MPDDGRAHPQVTAGGEEEEEGHEGQEEQGGTASALSDAGRLTLCVRRARHVCASARGASRRLRASLVAQWGVRGA